MIFTWYPFIWNYAKGMIAGQIVSKPCNIYYIYRKYLNRQAWANSKVLEQIPHKWALIKGHCVFPAVLAHLYR